MPTTRPTLVVLALLLASDAWGYALLRTETGDAVSWPEMPVRYAIDAAGTQTMDDAWAEAAVHAAFAAWQVDGTDLGFRYEGRRADPPLDYHPERPEEAANVVHFVRDGARLPDGQLAFTLVRYDYDTGALLNAHIFVDEANHRPELGGHAYDLQSTLTHEVGHFVGLDHSAHEGAVMRSGLAPGDTSPRTLEEDDLRAAMSLYGPPEAEAPAVSEDTFESTPEAPRGGGCAAADGASGWAALLLLGLVGLRRRLALVAGLLCLAPQADAAVAVALDVDALARRAGRIVEGRVRATRTTQIGGFLFTDAEVTVVRCHKGDCAERTLTVRSPGGRHGRIVEVVPGAARLRVGESVLLFLEAGAIARPIAMAQGKFTVRDTVAGRVVTRDLQRTHFVGPPPVRGAPLSGVLDQVQAALGGLPAAAERGEVGDEE